MAPPVFAILMVLALGTLAGTALGLVLGYLSGTRKSAWSLMTRRQQAVSLLLVLVCSAICIAVLGWYSLTIAPFV